MIKRRITAFTLAVIMALSFVSVDVFAEEVAVARTIEILEVSGEVITTRGTPRENRATVGMNLHNGHTASTGTDSSCTLIFDDGSLITMDQRSKIQVSQASRNRLSVNVVNGGLLVDAITQQGDNSVSVRVGNTSLTIRGTLFVAENRADGVAVYTMFEGWGEVDGVVLPPLHIMRVHETIADEYEISTDVDRTFELIPFYLSDATSLFTLYVLLSDTDRFIESGVISEEDIPVIEDLIRDRIEEEDEARAPSLAGGLIRFFNLLRYASAGDSGDGSSGGSDGGSDDGPGNVITLNRAPLTQAITTATNLMSPVNTLVRTTALSARVNEMWATQANFDTLSAEVAAANVLLDQAITFNELNTAVATLNAATDHFAANRHPGLIPSDGTIFSPALALNPNALPVNVAFTGHIGTAHSIMINAFNELTNFIAANGEFNIPNFIDAPPPVFAAFSSFTNPEQEFQFLLAAFKEAEALFNAVLGVALEFSTSTSMGFTPDANVIEAMMNEINQIVESGNLPIVWEFNLPDWEEAVQNALDNPEENGSNSNEFIPDTDIGNDANESLAAANEVVRGVVIAQRADDVDRGRYWVTREIMTQFTLAANSASSDLSTEARRVRDAFEDLRDAREAADTAASAFENALSTALGSVENWQNANEERLLIEIQIALEENNATTQINRILADADTQVRNVINNINPQYMANLTAANNEVTQMVNMLAGIRAQATVAQQRIAQELNQSIAAFESELRPGTRPVSVYKGELTRAILNAHDARSLVTVGVGTYGALRGQRFVTVAQWNTFDAAIAQAGAVWRNVNATTQQVASAAATLNAATNQFNGQIAEGQQPPENTGLVIAVGSAFNFVGSTVIAENSAAVPYGTRWVPDASARTFAGEGASWGTPFDANNVDDIDICPSSELGVALYMFDRIAMDNTITQAMADDMEINLTTAQVRAYNAGGRGTRVDLFPGEDGTKVWRLERNGSPLGYFTNIHNAQVHAVDGDTLVLVGEETVGSGLHIIFRYIHMVIAEDATLTVVSGVRYTHHIFSFGDYRLSNFGTIEILPSGNLVVLSDAQLDNHGIIRLHSGGVRLPFPQDRVIGSQLLVQYESPTLQLMDGIPSVTLMGDVGAWGFRVPVARHPNQGVASGAASAGRLINHPGAVIDNQTTTTYIDYPVQFNPFLPARGYFINGFIVEGQVINNGTITGEVLLTSVDTARGPDNPVPTPLHVTSLWMRPLHIGHSTISGNGNHGTVRDLGVFQQTYVEAHHAFLDLQDLFFRTYGDIPGFIFAGGTDLMSVLDGPSRTLRNNTSATPAEIATATNNIRAAVAALSTSPPVQDRSLLRAALQRADHVRDLLESSPSPSVAFIRFINSEMGVAISHYQNQFLTAEGLAIRTLELESLTSGIYHYINPPTVQLDTAELEALIAFAKSSSVADTIRLEIFAAELALIISTTQAEIDFAYQTLYNVLDSLGLIQLPVQLDTAALEELIAHARYVLPTLTDDPLAFMILEMQIGFAETTLATAITQNEIDEAYQDLLAILNMYDLAPQPPIDEPLDTAALEALIAHVRALLEQITDPMDINVILLSFLLTPAEAALANATTQEEIDEAYMELLDGLNLLGLAPQPPVDEPLDTAALEALIAFARALPVAGIIMGEIYDAETSLLFATTQAEIDEAYQILFDFLDFFGLAPPPPSDEPLDTAALETLIAFARALPVAGIIMGEIYAAETALLFATTQAEIDEAYQILFDFLDFFGLAPGAFANDTVPMYIFPTSPTPTPPPEDDDYDITYKEEDDHYEEYHPDYENNEHYKPEKENEEENNEETNVSYKPEQDDDYYTTTPDDEEYTYAYDYYYDTAEYQPTN